MTTRLEKQEHIDPICGMTVTPENAAGKIDNNGVPIYFCSKLCMEKYKSQMTETVAIPIQISREKPGDAELHELGKQTEIDPVCGMKVNPETAAAKFEHEGKMYYFCCPNCLKQFKEKNGAPVAEDFTQISRKKSSAADKEFIDPICGMTVTPETAAAKYIAEDGETVYFCATGCKDKYVSQIEIGEYKSANEDQLDHGKVGIVSHGEMKSAPQGEFIDPVCGMSVAPETAAGKYDFEGETYYFCATSCLTKFKQNPKNFLEAKKEEKIAAVSEGVEYTCPMHPEIIQIGPGSCPKCGMALEPKIISLDDAPDPEFIDMKRRFWISAVLTFPVFALAMAEMLPNFHQMISPTVSLWIQFVLATPVVLWGGYPFFVRGVESVKKRKPEYVYLDRDRNGRGVFI